jgi:hypothetical protein
VFNDASPEEAKVEKPTALLSFLNVNEGEERNKERKKQTFEK